MNDSHGYLDLHQEMFWAGDRGAYRKAGGYGRIATLVQRIRQERPGQVLAFDCGDTLHGTYPAVKTKGQALVPILNALRFDAMTAHWEFAYGPQRFQEIVNQLDYPMLAINCYDAETDELVFAPYTIAEAAGLRVGVVGIAATIVDKVMPASFSEGIYFTLGNRELPGYIEKLRQEEKADLVVLVSHLGFPQEVQLAGEVDGIDVLLSGHTHNRLYRPVLVNDTIVIQSGCHGSFLGRLDLEVDRGRVVDFRHQLITVEKAIAPDPAVQALVEQALTPHRQELSQVVGHTATPLNRYTMLEATMDNLLLQSLLDLTGAQVAFSNGWRYGAPVVPGPVSLNDLWNIIPVNPPVSTCELTGAELRTMMEESLEHTFARDPYDQMGGYVKRCQGLNLYCKIENPSGQRVQEFFVRGERVKPDRLYDAVFVTTQGVPARYGTHRQHLDVHAIEALQRYLVRTRPVEAGLRGTIVAV
ncbi:MAG: bifunctional metallophosphatase/5'-nucleotidase [Chloroflexi bacterium]|nr:bifunctional metallophosphatase/5'-nucleotidase [Chloroflexota bacterium]MBU1750690.1 bifunctional metallophosphatase/5'-nucleotidase [Chloroflexota bacterium]